MSTTQEKEVEEILNRIDETLLTAKHGYDDFTSIVGPKRYTGLRNFLVFARSVTFVIQNLKGKVENFDPWYTEVQKALQENPTLKYFVELRNEILKQGKLETNKVSALFDSRELHNLPRPPGATAFIIGDQYGGNGWKIDFPDGSSEMYYIELPTSVGYTQHEFGNVPDKYAKILENKSIEKLCMEYLDLLSHIVKDCRNKFSKSKPAGKERPYLRLVK